MYEPVRILNITTVLRAAGIESFIFNMYRNVNRTNVQFDFLVMRNQREFYDDEIGILGGKKYTIDVKGKNVLLRILRESIELYKFLKKNPYKIVHVHYTTPLRAFYLLAAKLAKTPVRIYHSHSAAVSGKSSLKMFVYAFCQRKITNWATDYFACSRAAADWIFEKALVEADKVKIICNGIDTKRFCYSEAKREEVRHALSLQDYFVLIHTGRFIDQKNQSFVLDVFSALKAKCDNAKLLFLGTGDQLQMIKDKAQRLSVADDVLFLGVRPNVEDYLCAADCYVMPSLYEGLPVAAIEAQCSGLPCVLSNNITCEVKVTDDVVFLSLNDKVDKWVDAILAARNAIRKDVSSEISKFGYDVCQVAERLELFYLSKSNDLNEA